MAVRADLIVTGRIATLAGARGFGWVQAIAVGEGRIVAAGRRTTVGSLQGPATRRLDLGPHEVLLPAITDAHLHLTDAAVAGQRVQLDGLALDATLERLAALHQERLRAGDLAGWIEGLGWSIDQLGSWPEADALERVAPGRPIALWSHDLHTRWVSRAALAAAGITSRTPDPPGGSIAHDGQGQPSGLLLEHAAGLVDRAIPPLDEALLARAIAAYAARLAGLGVVGCHDPGGLAPDPDMERGPVQYARLAQAGRLPLRVHASVRPEQLDAAEGRGLRSGQVLGQGAARHADPVADRAAARARVGWLKLFADGALGSRSGALLSPYADRGGQGRLLLTPGELRGLIARAARIGIVPQVHVIGDRALRVALDALEAVPSARGGRVWARLEHVQLAAARDVARLRGLGVAASVQPAHLLHDAAMARRAWPRRQARAYRWGSLASTGIPLPFGTDAPVEPPDPWPGIATAVTRRLPDEARPFPGAEQLELARAIRAATLDPAVVAGEEGHGGRLTPGHRADFIVIPAEALAEPVRPGGALAGCRPRLTVMDGETVARAADFDR
ncbi:MAG TPA: amidohydrolase [Candidatus Sulfotelmatobacter sp.]|nr:amidohydrolase [Candidatus Sulfotelmatobacter sp.]